MNENFAREILNTQLEMQQQTMQYIGREIHDNVGQKLTLAALYAQQIDYEKQCPGISERIVAMSSIINESLSELRSLSKNLISDHIVHTDIITLLQQETEKINAANLCRIHFTTNTNSVDASYAVKNIVVRIVQEFIQNSLKHAGCKNIVIIIKYLPDGLHIAASDDGKGFNENELKEKGIGLIKMKKRSAVIGAAIDIKSIEGSGTSLEMFIPQNKINV